MVVVGETVVVDVAVGGGEVAMVGGSNAGAGVLSLEANSSNAKTPPATITTTVTSPIAQRAAFDTVAG